MKKILSCFVLAILAGLSIGLGSFVYLSCLACDQKILGSILFSVGLLLVCAFSLNLFTGKIGFVFENKPSFLLNLLIMYLGNIVGAVGSGYLLFLALSPLGDKNIIGQKATAIAEARMIDIGNGGQPFYSALIMGIFCGMLVFLAVYAWKKFDNIFLKSLILILCVTTFVATGTEHCIANMFYFSICSSWNLSTILDILIVTVGNAVGSIFLWLLFEGVPKLVNKKAD